MGELLWRQLWIPQGPEDLRKLQELPEEARRAPGRAAELPALCQSKIYRIHGLKAVSGAEVLEEPFYLPQWWEFTEKSGNETKL